MSGTLLLATTIAFRGATLIDGTGAPPRENALLVVTDGRVVSVGAATPKALAALPPGTVKSAAYADGHWTLELARADPAVIGDLDARMRAVRVPMLVATSANGARVRIGGP